jgi:hypothetical protein
VRQAQRAAAECATTAVHQRIAADRRDHRKSAAIKNVTHLWVSLNEYEAEPYQTLMKLPLERTLAKLDRLHELVAKGRYPHHVTISRVTDGSERDKGFLAFVQQRYPAFRPFLIGEGNWSGQVRTRSERRVPGTGCFRWYELSIMASGKVALCCMDGEGKHVIGDVRTQSALEIYNSPGYRKMRQFTFSRKSAAAPCDVCLFLEHDPEKLGARLDKGGNRFSEKIMLKQEVRL